MKQNQRDRPNSMLFISITTLVLLIMVVALGVSIYAWAKYTSQNSGTAAAQVARWRFELKDGMTSTTDKIDFPITRTDGKYDVVAEGTIAPGTYGVIPITVDTTGTEVHMKYELNISIENCPTNMVFYNNQRKRPRDIISEVARSGEGTVADPKVATINITKYIDKSKHGEHQELIYWEWPFETFTGNGVNANDVIDSADMNKKMTMAITATGTQVLEIQDPGVPKIETLYALYESSTNTLKLSSKPFENYSSNDTYYGNFYNQSVTTTPPWYNIKSSIKKVEILDEIQPLSTYKWFYECRYLTEITNLDLLDTSQVSNMAEMFYSCTKLTNIDVSEFETSKVTSMSGMFSECNRLTSLDVSGFDTSSVTDMSGMFSECNRLTSLDVSGFDTSSVTSMSNMFMQCMDLTGLDVSGFDTSKVTSMRFMFSQCYKLTSLDVSGFDTGNVTNMQFMFYRDENLKTIYASDKFTTQNVTSSTYMFDKSTQLVGGSGTMYSSSNTNKTYARIDTAETPGYFTAKP